MLALLIPVDNLYMDLNGIVHMAIHGNDPKRHERISKKADFEEVWADIMRAIDEIIHIVKPKKLIMLALDGVAPRAKMNQQRARRFKSAKDAQDKSDQYKKSGKEAVDLFDSNQISPGTQFMNELGEKLEWFIRYKISTDPIYQNVSHLCSLILAVQPSDPIRHECARRGRAQNDGQNQKSPVGPRLRSKYPPCLLRK